MGGIGSGRSRGRRSVESCLSIDVREWQRLGYLNVGRKFTWKWNLRDGRVFIIGVVVEEGRIALQYKIRTEDCSYHMALSYTPCHFGGTRVWFRCPGRGCGRRVAKLHLRNEAFLCRDCNRLAYCSQRLTRSDRAIRQAIWIREKLGGEPSLIGLFPTRPARMHRKTYSSLLERASRYEAIVCRTMIHFIERMKG
mgnify:CR=1 FL=1